ncbi:transcriptional regulator [Vibrio sp. UCD-FRSSP16_10]|uniref:ArsR/SmtB family transcription factor n=1 Tax=unclassified Vibrio TaxID=2614977 RepID=UPI0007FE692B|nr:MULTISPECIES: winged helix-turn-helix domain-containing protein [unclassified Vibrio]OBT17217.1 transcriptional regulator [Vibrio sp. UCD-FRSSP16_30]OBT22986.1 transcriptional regulator [Vibrio sp. UCD-FRSSP16_10]
MTDCQSKQCEAPIISAKETRFEQELAAMAKAIAHPARVRILKVLFELEAKGGCLNGDLVGQLGLAQSTVSEHLRILREAGLIRSEPMPPKVCYRIEMQGMDRLQQLFKDLF